MITHQARHPPTVSFDDGPVRTVVGVGATTPRHQLAYRAALALAERLGTSPVTFPGDHSGFGSRPREFAETLHEILVG